MPSPPASHRFRCRWLIRLPMLYCRLITIKALVATTVLIIRYVSWGVVVTTRYCERYAVNWPKTTALSNPPKVKHTSR